MKKLFLLLLSIVALQFVSYAQPVCSPCTGGTAKIAPAAVPSCSNNVALNPTNIAYGGMTPGSGGPCTSSNTGAYGTACMDQDKGKSYTSPYHTWMAYTVPATGIVGIQVVPDATTEFTMPSIRLFSSITCTAGAISANTFVDCSFQNGENCGGGYDCGSGNAGTMIYTNSGPTGGASYGQQAYFTGLTPGTVVYALIDYHFFAAGATAPVTGTIDICSLSNFPAGSSNQIGSAGQLCATGTVNATTQGSIQGQSLCNGYKPPNCGGGPAPSFENVSLFLLTANAAGDDMSITTSGTTCTASTLGVQLLVYTAGDLSGCTGTTPICGAGTCTLGACVGGNTASGMANKTVNIVGPTPGQTYVVVIDGFAGSMCSFTIDATNCIVLPITLLDFKAKIKEGFVQLDWTTVSERENDFFTIEKSLDGKSFYPIGVVDGQGNSTTTTAYELKDPSIIAGVPMYYRLKQTDFDGSNSYSQTVVARSDLYENPEIVPNPTIDVAHVVFNGNGSYENVEFIIYDINGKQVNKFIHKIHPSLNEIPFEATDLSTGMYMVEFNNGSEKTRIKFSKY